MYKYEVFFSPAAEGQIAALEDYISQAASPAVAFDYVDALITYCYSLSHSPHRGSIRDDIRKGVRITNFRKRTIIAFTIEEAQYRVIVLGVFYGGQDYAPHLKAD